MGNNYNNNLENSKSLSELFKEVQDIRYGRAEPKEIQPPKEEIKFNRIYVVNHKFNAVGAIIGILFLILFSTAIHSNSIFATSEEEKIAIEDFEENEKALNMMNIISSNISELTTKEIINQEINIEFETKYIENNELPKDEEVVIQEGVLGSIEQTIIRTFENNELVSENIISEVRKSEPVEEIIEIGTSEYLKEKEVHLGDTMYTTEDVFMYPEAEETDTTICKIYGNIDVKLLAESDGWAKVSVDNYEGYVKGDLLTSENLTPGIAEKARIKRLQLSVKMDMKLNKPSGLTREDFIKVLSGNSSDKNKIFEDNAEFFYEVEQKYNVNGIFLAAIGIHESNWGTSNISTQKKNLFGFGSYDDSAYESSADFDSYQNGIEKVAKALAKEYLNEPGTVIFDNITALGTYYNGPTITGVNVRYASDSNWSNRILSIMELLYERL
jgi:beta-N-acetylglucosaminidase